MEPLAHEYLIGPPRGRRCAWGLPLAQRQGRRPWGGPADDGNTGLPYGAPNSGATGRPRSRGFTYLGLLFFVAITAASLAALGQSWSTAMQRERERELEFRGEEIARAIASYVKASPGSPPQYPEQLTDLLIDRRGAKTRHHLRRAYLDPFTGKPDWVLVPEQSLAGAPASSRTFNAVHSSSKRQLLRQTQPDGTPLSQAEDWVFSASTYLGQGLPPQLILPPAQPRTEDGSSPPP
jgi:type II secretory pathway pseudopilin PulG